MAAVALRDDTLGVAAARIDCSYQHLYLGLKGKREMSRHLLGRLRNYLGEGAWRYVTGGSDVLPEETPRANAA